MTSNGSSITSGNYNIIVGRLNIGHTYSTIDFGRINSNTTVSNFRVQHHVSDSGNNPWGILNPQYETLSMFDNSGSLFLNHGDVSGSSTSTGSFGHVKIPNGNIDFMTGNANTRVGIGKLNTSMFYIGANPSGSAGSGGNVGVKVGTVDSGGNVRKHWTFTSAGNFESQAQNFGSITMGGTTFKMDSTFNDVKIQMGYDTVPFVLNKPIYNLADVEFIQDEKKNIKFFEDSQTGGEIMQLYRGGINVSGSGNISGSSTSTGSFGHGHFASQLGVGTTSPGTNLIHGTGDKPTTLRLDNTSSALNYILLKNSTSANNYIQTNAQSIQLNADANGSGGIVDLMTNNTLRLRIDASGHATPGADNTYDLGSSTKRWANIHSADLHLSNEDTEGNEVDGTTGNWTIQEGEDDLYLLNRKNGKKYRFKLEEIK